MAAHITNDFRLPSCPVTSAARATHELMKAVSCNSLAPGPGRLPSPTRSTSRVAGRASRETPSHAHAHSLHTPASRTASHDTRLHLSLTYTHPHAHHPTDCNSRTHHPAHHSRHAPASVLDRLELGETPRRVELAFQELGRSRWAAASLQVTNYEFERVAHTELHTPGLLVTRRGARSCPGWSATRSAAVAEPA